MSNMLSLECQLENTSTMARALYDAREAEMASASFSIDN
jgi:hypothetical protein